MLQQDLAGAMLLYDDIDRKGFEGDLVINGFSEFIRNLLVCKDERVAGLLEVVESFKDKYIATGKKTPVAYLISALNILNEAEINFKGARNKRLHTELAIIKLTYLQQALELAATDDGIGKKKVVDNAQPVDFRKLGMVEDRSKKQEVGSQKTEVVGQKAAAAVQKTEVSNQKPEPVKQQPYDEAKLIITDVSRKKSYEENKSLSIGTNVCGNK